MNADRVPEGSLRDERCVAPRRTGSTFPRTGERLERSKLLPLRFSRRSDHPYEKAIADRLIFRFLSPPDSGEIKGSGNLAQTVDQGPHGEVMSMSESRYHKVRSEQIIAVRFRMTASADEVVAHLLEAVRGTNLSLLKVIGDGDRVYPFEGRDPARSLGASSWRAELFWYSPTLMSAGGLELFLKRAKFFLEVPSGVRLELRGGQRNPREDVQNPG